MPRRKPKPFPTVLRVDDRHRTEAQGETACMDCRKSIKPGDVYAVAEIQAAGQAEPCIVCDVCGERMRKAMK